MIEGVMDEMRNWDGGSTTEIGRASSMVEEIGGDKRCADTIFLSHRAQVQSFSLGDVLQVIGERSKGLGSALLSSLSDLSLPRRNESFWKELDHVKNLWKNKQELHVEQAGIAALFGLECFAWFCAGEIVGRGFTFTGYYV
ncbi:ATPase, F0 complex, subunit G, mitochondrial [Cynara cardunculus var. scolymus]|uniref:ATPase, F0 complex, subunit G, mitochondrial n=1 Tax=Cynara cardunculus var. scolymus TaxID=59895 RepID=A0A118JT13_CYNCS|nr:ATPase, F0 complex, subunit G, mitochondrial [Cynara cardunculus var. scolymus]